MFSGSGGELLGDSPTFKVTMKEYADMSIKVGDRVGIKINKADNSVSVIQLVLSQGLVCYIAIILNVKDFVSCYGIRNHSWSSCLQPRSLHLYLPDI